MKIQAHKLFYSISFLQFFMSEITGTTLILFLLFKGLSLEMANYLLVILFLSVFLLEVPTGAISDKYGRKISMLLGLVCFMIYSVLFVMSEDMWLLMIAQVFGGLAICLQSGSLESWVVEHSDRPIETLFTNANSIRYISGILCGLLGAALASYSYALPWFISMISIVVTFILVAGFMIEHHVEKRRQSSLKLTDIVKESIHIGMSNKAIWIVFLIGVFISFSNSAGNTFQQPRLVGLSGEGVWIMGMIKAGYSLCMTLGSLLVQRLYRKYQDVTILIFSCLMLGIWLFAAGVFNTFYPVLVTFLIYEVGRGMYPAAKQIFLNKRISNEYRSTLLSLDSAISQLGMCIGLVVTGIISRNFLDLSSDQAPIRLSWIICGLIAIVPVFFLLYHSRSARESHSAESATKIPGKETF
ncbi:MFS transporter [Paenibacillus sp. FSL K6-1230]|uniref:MFS transporter n=1 Tax=Paenibacillus sp. FSL K6-1230 TaxID=2921603 RepID=UPI0030FB8900